MVGACLDPKCPTFGSSVFNTLGEARRGFLRMLVLPKMVRESLINLPHGDLRALAHVIFVRTSSEGSERVAGWDG